MHQEEFDIINRFFERAESFFERIKRMNVVKLFLLTWVIHFSWTVVVGIVLTLCGAKFSQHVAASSEFTNSFLLIPFTALAEEMMFRWGPMVVLVFLLTYCYRNGRLTKERYFYVEKHCLLCLTLILSIIFGWVHGNVFNVLLQGVSGIIFFIIYLRCFFIERDCGVRDRWQIVPLAEAAAYHTMSNAFLIFL